MIRFLKRFRRSDDGAALVETAIIAPVAFLLFAGGFEIARAIFLNQQIEKSVRSASRYYARVVEQSGGTLPTNAAVKDHITGMDNAAACNGIKCLIALTDSQINALNVTVSTRTVDLDAHNRIEFLLVQAALTYNTTVLSVVMPNPQFTINARHEEPSRAILIP